MDNETVKVDQRQCWSTPADFWAVVNAEFEFHIDVAAIAENSKCARFITPEQDSLITPWFDGDIRRGWLNPPFKQMTPFSNKSAIEAIRYPDSVVCMLGPLTAAPWLTEFCYQQASEIRDLYPRIQFQPPAGIPMTSNAKDNVMVVFRRKPENVPANRFTWRWK